MSYHKSFIRGTPSMLTLVSMSLGLWSIRFTVNGQLFQAACCVLVCIILDGLDGRLARYLDTASNFGAVLDTLADFTSFAIAPAFLLYFTFEHDRLLWLSSVIFVVCMALRLARFAQSPPRHPSFFIGVPAPAGAMLVLTPIFALIDNVYTPTSTQCSVFLLITAVLLISKLPTFAVNKVKIPAHLLSWFAIGVVFLMSIMLLQPWGSMMVINLLYLLTIPISYRMYKKLQ